MRSYNAKQEDAPLRGDTGIDHAETRQSRRARNRSRWWLAAPACAPVSNLWDDCKFRAPRGATIDASGARSVRVRAFSGELDIQGHPDLTEVRVTGSACAFEEGLLEGIDIKTGREGGELFVEAALPAGRVWEGTGRLDLEIEVPSFMRLDIVDGSGGIEVANVASLRVDDGSGPLSISGIAGDVDIKDGGGDLDIEDVRGHVKIDDGRGDITIRDIGGSLTMSDRNGDISVKRVGGDFTLQSDQKGDVSHSDIGGRVTILGQTVPEN